MAKRLANPAPLGLFGFALTTALLQGGVTGITGVQAQHPVSAACPPASRLPVMLSRPTLAQLPASSAEGSTTFLVYGYAFAFGGAAQALAGGQLTRGRVTGRNELRGQLPTHQPPPPPPTPPIVQASLSWSVAPPCPPWPLCAMVSWYARAGCARCAMDIRLEAAWRVQHPPPPGSPAGAFWIGFAINGICGVTGAYPSLPHDGEKASPVAAAAASGAAAHLLGPLRKLKGPQGSVSPPVPAPPLLLLGADVPGPVGLHHLLLLRSIAVRELCAAGRFKEGREGWPAQHRRCACLASEPCCRLAVVQQRSPFRLQPSRILCISLPLPRRCSCCSPSSSGSWPAASPTRTPTRRRAGLGWWSLASPSTAASQKC